MTRSSANRSFQRYRKVGRPEDLARVFDATAAELLRVASHLAPDLHQAEDLVQSTFLAAIQKRALYEPKRDVLAWLLGILVNKSREQRRENGRRPDPDRLPQNPAPDPAEAATAQEISRAASDAIARLEEPYRPVLSLHLRHGLTASEIALSLGRPAGTVRTQMVRGMQLLRRALPTGIATAFAVVVTPTRGLAAIRSVVVQSASAAAPVAVAVASTLAGAVLMKKAVLGISLVVAATVVTWAVWPETYSSQGDDSFVGQASLQAPVRPPGNELSTDSSNSGAPLQRRAVAATDPSETPRGYSARVTGRCIDRYFRSLDGVEVKSDRRHVIATTDSRGSFTLVLPLGDRMTESFVLSMEREGYGRKTLEVVLRAGGTTDLGNILLMTPALVSGRVVDAEGAPFPGAVIRIKEALGGDDDVQGSRFEGPSRSLVEGKSDDSGKFRFEDVPVRSIRAWAGARDMVWAWTDSIEVPPSDEVTDIVLQLLPLTGEDTIDLRVIDPSGAPVPHASVYYVVQTNNRSSSATLVTDALGRCRKFVDVKAPHSFLARDPEGRFGAAIARNVEPGTSNLVLRLSESESFTLRVKSENEDPVERYRANLRDSEHPLMPIGLTSFGPADHGGTMEITKPPAPFLLKIEANAYAVVEIGPFDPNHMPDTVEITLTALPRSHGRVIADGQGVHGAQVSLHRALGVNELAITNGFPARSSPSAQAQDETDDDGGFEITIREAGRYYLRAEALGFAPVDLGPLELRPEFGAKALDLHLGRGGSIRGRILVGETEGLGGWIVGISRGDGFAISRRTDADGRFHFQGLTPGRWLVRRLDKEIILGHTSSGTRTKTSDDPLPWNTEVFEGQTTEFELDLRSLRTLSGKFLLGSEALNGWRATLSSPQVPGSYESHSSSLDSEGRFQISAMGTGPMGTGPFRLVLSGKLDGIFCMFVRFDFQLLPNDNEWSIDIPVGSVQGTVAGELLEKGTGLQYEWMGGKLRKLGFSAQILTGSDGSFALTRVPAGLGEIVYHERGQRVVTPVDVIEDGRALVIVR